MVALGAGFVALAPLAGALVAFGFGVALAAVFCMSGFLLAFGAGFVALADAFGAGLVDFIACDAALVAFGAGLAAVDANAGAVIRNAAAIIDAMVFFKITPPFGATVRISLVERPHVIRATIFET